jgi:hypothetical protein
LSSVALPSLLLLALAACSGDERADDQIAAGGPALDPPGFYGFGTPADEARIADWDIDVRPDGTGLPAGRGTVGEGALVYQGRCSACHGPTGIEGPNNRLVGTEPWEDVPATFTVGNYWPYATTLYDYIVRAMPLDTPGSLTPDETYAVIAWILHRNELIAADAVMDSSTLPLVEMPARNRFVADDRLEANSIR